MLYNGKAIIVVLLKKCSLQVIPLSGFGLSFALIPEPRLVDPRFAEFIYLLSSPGLWLK
jgi:hypothetical protein